MSHYRVPLLLGVLIRNTDTIGGALNISTKYYCLSCIDDIDPSPLKKEEDDIDHL